MPEAPAGPEAGAAQPPPMRPPLLFLDDAARSPDPAVCPFFRFELEGDLVAPLHKADDGNRCAAIGEPRPQSARQQELVCLTRRMPTAPATSRGRGAPGTRRRVEGVRRPEGDARGPPRAGAVGRGSRSGSSSSAAGSSCRPPRRRRRAPSPSRPRQPDADQRPRRGAVARRDRGRLREPVAVEASPSAEPSPSPTASPTSPSPTPRLAVAVTDPRPHADARRSSPRRCPDRTPRPRPRRRSRPRSRPATATSSWTRARTGPSATSTGSGRATTCTASPTTSGISGQHDLRLEPEVRERRPPARRRPGPDATADAVGPASRIASGSPRRPRARQAPRRYGGVTPAGATRLA